MYDSVFGANVHYFVQRVRVCSQLNRRPRPHFFLTSATLSAAPEFAANPLSLSVANREHKRSGPKTSRFPDQID